MDEDWGELAGSLSPAPGLAVALRDFYAAGRQRWSELPPLDPADLTAHLARHLPPDADAVAHFQSLVAADLYLACACLQQLPGAVAAFDAHYLSRVPAFVGHIDASTQFTDELRQLLRERLLVRRGDDEEPRIARYSGRGALMVWVRVSAVRAALDQKEHPNEKRRADDALLDDLQQTPDPELDVLRARHAAELSQAIKSAIAALPPEQRVILRMYFSSGQNTQHIASALCVDRSTAARRLVAARQAVFDETRRLLQERLPIDTGEFASLARALHDQINISLSGLLARK
jgi:RNA polymerase sigma-70 factor (ECF subfamily)